MNAIPTPPVAPVLTFAMALLLVVGVVWIASMRGDGGEVRGVVLRILSASVAAGFVGAIVAGVLA